MSADVIFVSAEASGDELAVDVISRLRQIQPNLSIAAIGGPALERIGLRSPFDLSVLSIVGFAEALKIYRKVIKLADDVTDHIISQAPKVVVLVDSWGFSVRLAQRLRKRAPEIKIVKLVGPQVWASRAGRAKTLAATVDHLLCIHDFEVPFYEPFDLPCTVIGNPALSRMAAGNGEKFRSDHQIPPDKDILLVLPGSRSSELKRVAPTFVEATRILKSDPGRDLDVFVLVSPTIRDQFYASGFDWPAETRFIDDRDHKADLMAATSVAFACSGTITTELATQSCPMIVGYRLGFITYMLAKLILFKAKFFTLLNVAADRAVVPELLQQDFKPETVVKLARRVLDDPNYQQAQRRDIRDAVALMGWGQEPAHYIAASKILELSQ